MSLEDTPVFVFESGERTAAFSVYCFESLGFKNVQLISEGTTFKEKYLIFAKKALETKHNIFIRSDADCMPFSGVMLLLEKAINEKYDWLTGVYFDYVMNRFRGGTPQVLSRKTLDILIENKNYMPDSKKPETDFSIEISHLVKMGDVKIFTNLHEFEQFPSKVCNSFLNRLKRGHSYLYSKNYLDTLPDYYRSAIKKALDLMNNEKQEDNMHYRDMTHLDVNFSKIEELNFHEMHIYYSGIYNHLLGDYK